jgi:RecQ family ATP-dependent DNA helicase
MKILRANAPQQTVDEVDESLKQPDFGADWRPGYAGPSAARVIASIVGGARTLVPTSNARDPLARISDHNVAGHKQFSVDDPRIVLAEQLSHCMILDSAPANTNEVDPTLQRWIHIATRYIQRGLRPLIGQLPPTKNLDWSYEQVLGASLSPLHEYSSPLDRDVWTKLVADSPLQRMFLNALERDGIAWLLNFGYPEANLSALRHDPLKPESGEGRRCDWLFASRDGRQEKGKKLNQENLIVELDGVSFHSSSAKSDQRRDEENQRRGYVTIRLNQNDLQHSSSQSWKQLLRWASVISSTVKNQVDESRIVDVWEPTVIARIRIGIVRGVANGWLDRSDPRWVIRLVHDLPGWTPNLDEIISPLNALARIAGLESFPPLVVGDQGVATIDVRVGVPPFAQGIGADASTIAFRSTRFPTRPQFMELPQADGHGEGFPVADEQAITLIAHDAFGVPSLRPGQLEGIAHAFSGRNGLSVLPTSGGKSLIYWIAALCTAGLTIAIAPLRKLIDDQEDRLCNLGFDRVVATHSGRKDVDRGSPRLALRRIHDTFLALMTPERLQRRKFREMLQTLGERPGFAYVVVDEAHCVSEWGHDFRPAYLRVAAAIQSLSGHDKGDKHAPLIALTATASPAVQVAMIRDLGITEEDILTSGSTRRKELTFHNWIKQGPEPAAQRRKRAARSLLRAGELLSIEQSEWAKPHLASDPTAPSAIVFAQTKSTSSPMSVPELRNTIKSELHVSGEYDPVAIFHGSDISDTDDDLEEHVQRFMSNDANIMVSTKAFGMGIDKPNIRVTVHASLPSSIEQFVQEAGRAGRDGRPSIGVLSGNIPDVESTLVKSILNPTLTSDERKKLAAQLDANDKELKSDLETILFFLHSNRPGERDENLIAESVLESLLDTARPGLMGAVFAFDQIELNAFATLARKESGVETLWRDGSRIRQFVEVTLFRLVEIGLIADYSKEGFGASETYTIDFADYDVVFIQKNTLDALDRLNIGRRQENQKIVNGFPSDIKQTIRSAVRELIAAIYAVVLPDRIRGLAELIRIATGPAERMANDLAAYMDGGEVRERLAEYLASLIGDDATPTGLVKTVRDLPRASRSKWRGEAIFMLQGPAVEAPAFRAFRALAEWAALDTDANYAADEFVSALDRWEGQEDQLAQEFAALSKDEELRGTDLASGALTGWVRKYRLARPAPVELQSAAGDEGGLSEKYRIATKAQALLDQLTAFTK